MKAGLRIARVSVSAGLAGLAGFAACIVVACAKPLSGVPQQPAASGALRGSTAYELATSLASEVGPRLAGSPGDTKAVQWAQKTLRTFGLAAKTEPVIVPVWRRGLERAELLVNGERMPLAVTALGWSYPTSPAGVTAEVALFDSVDAVTRAPAGSLNGKIVFCNVRTARSVSGEGYGSSVAARSKCPLEAERQHAIGALVRSIGTDDGDDPHTGSMRQQGAKIPAAALSAIAAEKLYAALYGARNPLQVSLQLETSRAEDATSANVMAEVTGTLRPDEIVLVGAHLDSWDLGQGALDDGAGVGLALAIAAEFARAPGERTLRVVLFAAEENSLAGGKAYALAHAKEKHVAALELDSGTGRVYEFRVRSGTPIRLPTFSGVTLGLQPAEGGADISPLRALGVPVLDARQDMSDYFNVHHTRSDTVDKLRKDDLEQATDAVRTLLRFAATASSDFGQLPPAE